MADDNTMWFLRGGAPEGWITPKRRIGGHRLSPTGASGDLFGIAGGWTDPASSALGNQYTFKTFYRYQLTPNLAITRDVQYAIGPQLNPAIDRQVVLGLRLRA